MRPRSKRVPSDPGPNVVVTANVARLAVSDSRFRGFVTRALGIYRDGGAGVYGIEVRNGSRLFSTFTQAGLPGIELVRALGRTTVALASDY